MASRTFWTETIGPSLRGGSSIMISVPGHLAKVNEVTESGIKVDDPRGLSPTPSFDGVTYNSSDALSEADGGTSGQGDLGRDCDYSWDELAVPGNVGWVQAWSPA